MGGIHIIGSLYNESCKAYSLTAALLGSETITVSVFLEPPCQKEPEASRQREEAGSAMLRRGKAGGIQWEKGKKVTGCD